MNTLFVVSLIAEAIFGIGFILTPANLLAPMGVTLNDTSTTFARLFGSAIISFPFLLYLARKSENLIFKKSVVTSMFVYYSISTFLLFITQVSGQMNALGWSVVSLHFILTVWFGYYLVK
jgi:hypothetical protein